MYWFVAFQVFVERDIQRQAVNSGELYSFITHRFRELHFNVGTKCFSLPIPFLCSMMCALINTSWAGCLSRMPYLCKFNGSSMEIKRSFTSTSVSIKFPQIKKTLVHYSADNPRTTAKLPRAQWSGVELVTGSVADTAHILRCHAGLSLPAGRCGPSAET